MPLLRALRNRKAKLARQARPSLNLEGFKQPEVRYVTPSEQQSSASERVRYIVVPEPVITNIDELNPGDLERMVKKAKHPKFSVEGVVTEVTKGKFMWVDCLDVTVQYNHRTSVDYITGRILRGVVHVMQNSEGVQSTNPVDGIPLGFRGESQRVIVSFSGNYRHIAAIHKQNPKNFFFYEFLLSR